MKKYFTALNLILFTGLFLRLLHYYFSAKNNPIFSLPIVDAKEYVDDAAYYNDVSWLGMAGSYFHPPGYSYFIGILYMFFGKYLFVIRIAQIALDVLNIFLVYNIAETVFDRRIGLLSALFYAIYVRAIQYSIEILPPVLVIFLLLISIFFFVRGFSNFNTQKGNLRVNIVHASLSALFLGLLIITLPNFLLVIPAFLICIFFLTDFSLKARTLICILFLSLSLLPTSLTFLRNKIVADEGLIISRNGGVNFYIGNNPDINKTVSATPGIEWEKLLMLPYQSDRITNFKEQDKWFNKKALDYALNNFSEWATLMCKKTIWFFCSHEFPRNFDVYYFSQYSPITKYPVLNLSIILPLALSGIIVCLRFNKSFIQGTHSFFLISIILIYAFSIILVFIAARYRLPVIPLMIVFAGAFSIHMYDLFREKKFKIFSAFFVILVLFGFISERKFFSTQYPFTVSLVFTKTLLANTLINGGKSDEGKKYLDEAILLPADEATDDAYFELGHYYRGKKDITKARECFEKSVTLDFDNFKAWNSLGFDYKMEGNYFAAIHCLLNGIKTAPCFPELYMNLADCYLLRKKTDSAVVALESYYKNCPSPHPNIGLPLGKIYMDVYNDFEKAGKLFEESVLYPQGFDVSPESYNRLGACKFKLGFYKQAKEAWMKGLQIDSGFKAIQTNLEYAEEEIPNWKSL